MIETVLKNRNDPPGLLLSLPGVKYSGSFLLILFGHYNFEVLFLNAVCR